MVSEEVKQARDVHSFSLSKITASSVIMNIFTLNRATHPLERGCGARLYIT